MYYDAHIHLLDKNHLIDAQKKGVSSFIINSTTPNEWEQIMHTGLCACGYAKNCNIQNIVMNLS